MQLFYRKSGQGPALIILHGLFGISDNWAALAKRWSESFTVYAVDLRNHGQSPHNDTWNYSVMAEDIIELMGEERLHEPVILGHSMGGKVAMRLALDFPMALSGLIVSDIAPRKYPPHNREVVDALKKVQPELINSRKQAEEILSQSLHDPGTIQFLLKNLYWKESSDGNKQLSWRFNLPVIDQQLEQVYQPTNSPAPCDIRSLFIRGSRSHYITEEDILEIQNVFPRASVHTIADAGHWVHADQPGEMYRAVLEFMQ